jgi:uncharacterized protein (DUF3820 family)
MDELDWQNWKENLAETMEAFATMHMPFGKYGPQHYPPRGLPIYQLPAEYLMWFKQKGFPKGKLGQLLEALCEIHCTGAEAILAPLRSPEVKAHPLRKERPKHFEFGSGE